MTISDPRLKQILINLEEQRRWLVNVTWDPVTDDAEKRTGDVHLLGIAEQLIQEVHALIKVVSG